MKFGKYGVVLAALMLSQSAFAISFWGKVKNAFNDCDYSDVEYSQTLQLEKQITARLPEHYSGRFDERDFNEKPWMRDFRYVIVVNKAERGPYAQQMRIYEYGRLTHISNVSTGREGFELRRKNKVCAGAPPKSYWSQTPTGYYTPQYLNKDHKSSSWDSDMPFAIFYDVENGLALHEVSKAYIGRLGNRASGGCVRQDGDTAEALFNRVKETEGSRIPQINPNGTPVLDENGQVKYITQQRIVHSRTGELMRFNTFSALIIIENVQ
ncbi:L,D-transpeptidase [Bdellovibrio sp. 22V]|uniref:L,D-transpeptidase n=1 Tax=Bdellovibrio TaxID=958 RepID=UPI002542C60E|nr:L,D-transpeptidase [Bdellovibrio sp. 22V]WII72841.1 L,D-transpeptidase [Bdellovibrio sp. 22V]